MKLNLETKNKEQEIIKEYLENNVSEILANKINNGVGIRKDDKTLINKKDLDGFMKYASDEARKQVENNISSACVRDEVVFGWAIHYFEEDSIEGKLYNPDGTEYKPVAKNTVQQTQVKVQPKIEKPKQPSLFDFLTNNQPTEENKDDTEEEIEEDFDADEQDEELFGNNNFSKNVEKITKNEEKIENNREFLQNNQKIDYTTGEIITKQENTNTFDKDILKIISGLLDNNVIIK